MERLLRDMVEIAHYWNGLVSATDWQTFNLQAETDMLEIRPKIAFGDPIPFLVRSGPVRGAIILGNSGPPPTL